MNQVYIVGVGPGKYSQMTMEAIDTLNTCEVIVGYTVYIELIRAYFPGKELLTTPMKQEAARCRMAFEQSIQGKIAAMVCSGDAGVYGMAGLMLEIGADYPDCDITVVPGVTAALAGGAILGAPLIHDFAVISLSDLLTPWEKIEKRLECASAADFVICLYNPSSKKRQDYLKKSCQIMLQYKKPQTVCGIVSQMGRNGQASRITTLDELTEFQADMFTTIFIGNSQTIQINGKMVTPRGYQY